MVLKWLCLECIPITPKKEDSGVFQLPRSSLWPPGSSAPELAWLLTYWQCIKFFLLQTLAGSCGKFAPFEIKEHMVLAPRCRATLDQDLCDQLDRLLHQQNVASSFLSDLKGRLPLRSGPTQVCGHDTDIMNR